MRRCLFFTLLLLMAAGYYLLCYQTLRSNFIQVFGLFTILFAGYFFITQYFAEVYFKQLITAGILFRLLLLFSVPNLSDDVYRFIWDGRLSASGINPFSQLPANLVASSKVVTGLTPQLFAQLNSPGYFTIYPPVMQAAFWFAGKCFPTNIYAGIVCLKGFILLAEVGNIFLLPVILRRLKLPEHWSLIYILNPLVITELMGNVHFEAAMIFFMLLSLYLFLKKKKHLSAVALGLSICTKLVPVIFIPLIIAKLGWKKGMIFSVISGAVTLILFLFMLDEQTIKSFFASIDLFFTKFEFNASLYYLVRWLGYQLNGYNIIAWAGPWLAVVSTITILLISFPKPEFTTVQFFAKALLIVTVYYLCSTTVHPWYIVMPVALSVFTRYRFALAWSYVVTLSYYAYHFVPVKESLWLVGLEYVVVVSWLLWELGGLFYRGKAGSVGNAEKT